jgi:nitric oxide reductase subunit C
LLVIGKTPYLFFGVCLLTVIMMFGASAGLGTRPGADAARDGYALWRAKGCEGCHTLFGQGGAFAPDLTHIYSQRGEAYLREFMVNPGAFHPDQRVMPRFGLTLGETNDLFAFLAWVDEQSPNWPPSPINVSGSGLSPDTASETALTIPEDPVEQGRYYFQRPPAICATCHSLEPDVIIVGPSLAGIATRAANRVPGQSAEDYIRNSILNPGEYVVEGFQNVMAQNLGDVLSSDQINTIIAFLLTLEES